MGARCSTETGETGETIQDDCSCRKTVCSPISIIQDVILCGDESITYGNQIISETIQIIDTFQNQLGCDSIITINVAKLDVALRTQDATVLEKPMAQYSWTLIGRVLMIMLYSIDLIIS